MTTFVNTKDGGTVDIDCTDPNSNASQRARNLLTKEAPEGGPLWVAGIAASDPGAIAQPVLEPEAAAELAAFDAALTEPPAADVPADLLEPVAEHKGKRGGRHG